MATSFVLIFCFENSHYINITLVFKAKTKNKIINPKTSIYLFTVPKIGVLNLLSKNLKVLFLLSKILKSQSKAIDLKKAIKWGFFFMVEIEADAEKVANGKFNIRIGQCGAVDAVT